MVLPTVLQEHRTNLAIADCNALQRAMAKSIMPMNLDDGPLSVFVYLHLPASSGLGQDDAVITGCKAVLCGASGDMAKPKEKTR